MCKNRYCIPHWKITITYVSSYRLKKWHYLPMNVQQFNYKMPWRQGRKKLNSDIEFVLNPLYLPNININFCIMYLYWHRHVKKKSLTKNLYLSIYKINILVCRLTHTYYRNSTSNPFCLPNIDVDFCLKYTYTYLLVGTSKISSALDMMDWKFIYLPFDI